MFKQVFVTLKKKRGFRFLISLFILSLLTKTVLQKSHPHSTSTSQTTYRKANLVRHLFTTKIGCQVPPAVYSVKVIADLFYFNNSYHNITFDIQNSFNTSRQFSPREMCCLFGFFFFLHVYKNWYLRA